MNEKEKNVYKNLFEHPTKMIVELYEEKERLEKENKILREFNRWLKEEVSEMKKKPDSSNIEKTEYLKYIIKNLRRIEKDNN